jgi:hypothetical protein
MDRRQGQKKFIKNFVENPCEQKLLRRKVGSKV